MKIPFYIILTLLLTRLPAAAQSRDTLHIHFDFNKSDITSKAAATIDSFLAAGKPYQVQQIDLYGHCDFIGNNRYNDSLSLSRVTAVKTFLLQKGLPATLFHEAIGYGERQPVSNENTDAARALNRRVEMVLYLEPVMITQQTSPAKVTTKPSLSEKLRDTAVKAGTSLVLQNLNFQGGRHFLLPSSEPVLQELSAAMLENPGLVIEIQGHVCCTLSNEDGLDLDMGTTDLSVQRAKAIYEYLANKGIDTNRMSYKGFGGSRKLYPQELNEMQRSQNRRVEIRIIKK